MSSLRHVVDAVRARFGYVLDHLEHQRENDESDEQRDARSTRAEIGRAVAESECLEEEIRHCPDW